MVEHCLRLPSWHGCMKFLDIDWNCNLSPMTLISLPIVLSKTIGLKALEELYDFLLGLGMMTDVETLKYEG